MDCIYVNGVIAVKEKRLLGDKIFRMSEMTAEDAFRTLAESGFGQGAEGSSVYDFEKYVEADERDLDAFIRKYAPSRAEKEYFLSPRDFHNAKAIVKSGAVSAPAEKLLGPNGLIPASEIAEKIGNGRYDLLPSALGKAVKEAVTAIGDGADGAAVGMIFERAQYEHLSDACKRSGVLKRLLTGKIDRVNLLSAFRAASAEKVTAVKGGKLGEKEISLLFRDPEKLEKMLSGGELRSFAAACFEAKRAGTPYTLAEKMLDSYEADFFAARRFDLDKSLPFLYYVFRRRAENANVRILFVCLNAGLGEKEIKARLRAGREGL